MTTEEDISFERRWTAWKARGLAHERAARQHFLVGAIIAGVIGFVAFVAYGLLSS